MVKNIDDSMINISLQEIKRRENILRSIPHFYIPSFPVKFTSASFIDMLIDIRNTIADTTQSGRSSAFDSEINPAIKNLLDIVQESGSAVSKIVGHNKREIKDFIKFVDVLKEEGLSNEELFQALVTELPVGSFLDDDYGTTKACSGPSRGFISFNVLTKKVARLPIKPIRAASDYFSSLSKDTQFAICILYFICSSVYCDIIAPAAKESLTYAIEQHINTVAEIERLENMRRIKRLENMRQIAVDEVWLKCMPSLSSDKKIVLKRGTLVTWFEGKNGWSHIKWRNPDDDTFNGWVEDKTLARIVPDDSVE